MTAFRDPGPILERSGSQFTLFQAKLLKLPMKALIIPVVPDPSYKDPGPSYKDPGPNLLSPGAKTLVLSSRSLFLDPQIMV